MKVNILFSNKREKGDYYYKIRVSNLMKFIDREDFECRKSKIIKDIYHQAWFLNKNKNILQFIPPTIYIHKGKICFINGRHRTALLINKLDVIPMLVYALDAYPSTTESSLEKNKITFEQIIISRVKRSDVFKLPKLPIQNLAT